MNINTTVKLNAYGIAIENNLIRYYDYDLLGVDVSILAGLRDELTQIFLKSPIEYEELNNITEENAEEYNEYYDTVITEEIAQKVNLFQKSLDDIIHKKLTGNI